MSGRFRMAYWHAPWYERIYRTMQCKFLYHHIPVNWEWIGHTTKPFVCMRCGKELDAPMMITVIDKAAEGSDYIVPLYEEDDGWE